MPRMRTTAESHITVRLPIDLDARVRALVERMSARAQAPVTMSYVLAEVVRLGLPAFERRQK